MNLMEESFQTKEQKNKKTVLRIVLVAIILVVLIIIGIVTYMVILQQEQMKIAIDGVQHNELSDFFLVEDGTVYAPIKRIAEYLGYKGYNGLSYEKSERNNECYVENENEIANFQLNSDKIYKMDLKSQTNNYEYAYTKKPVIARKGELYAASETLEKGFNISFEYNEDTNTITIFTLPYLVNYYNQYALDWNYKGISEELPNQKAILQGMLVVTNTNDKNGVLDTNGNTLLEAKYSDITYIPEVGDGGDFFVSDNGKVGIMSRNKETKIKLMYDEIKLLDQDEGLYIAKKSNKYGVLDVRGNVKIYIENDEIGIDTSKFVENGIINRYILAGNLIPVRKGTYWGLFNLKGEQVVEFEYDSFGYIATSSRDGALNLLVIPDYDVLVACKNKKYTLLNKYGQQLIDGAIADDIYMRISADQKSYTIRANNQEMDAIKYLDTISVKNMTEESDSPTNRNNNNDQENNGNDNSGNNENNEGNNQEGNEEQYQEGNEEQYQEGNEEQYQEGNEEQYQEGNEEQYQEINEEQYQGEEQM